MATARARRRDKQLNTLVQENFQLHKDIEDLETAYLLHRQNVETDQTSARGLLRKEIGGSRWEHGGAGKLTTYKVEKPADELLAPSQDGKSEARDSARKLLKQPDYLNGLADDNFDSSRHQNGNDSRRVKAFADMNSVGDDILQECNDKISDLKTKVLKKASSKIIRRESWSNSNDTKVKQKGTQPIAEAKNTPSKALNGSVAHTAKSKGVQRNNLVKNDIAVQKVNKSDGIKGKTFVTPQVEEEKAHKGDGNPVERRSRRDEYSKRSARKSETKAEKAEDIVPHGGDIVPRENSAREDSCKELSSEFRKSIGMTYTPRKIKPFMDETPSKVSNIFPTQPLEATEIYIDPKSGEVRVKSGMENIGGDLERHSGTVVLIQPGSARKSTESNKAPCTIIDEPSSQKVQTNVRDIFGLGTFDTVPKNTSEATSQNAANLSSSPFATAKDCNSEVEFWLRGLELPDVNKYVKIFTDNDMDLLDLEFMTAAQLHEMGIRSIGVLDKILKGIKDLKRTNPREKKSSSVRKKTLTASSIAWEDVNGETGTKLIDSKLKTSGRESNSVDKSCHDTNFASSQNFTDTRYERCNSALSNVSDGDFAREEHAGLQPSFASNTRASSAKHTDKRPPSAKGSGAAKAAGTGQSGAKVSSRSTVKSKKTDTTTAEKGLLRGNNLDSKPKKGVLLRPRSSSLNRDFTRSQGKRGQVQEEERIIREPRVRSRSADAVKRKAMQGVQAAAKKFEEKQQQRHQDVPQSLRADQRTRRDKMAARHLQREKTRETSIGEPVDSAAGAVATIGDSSHKEEGLESLVTVNIMSTPHSDPRHSVSEDLGRTQTTSKKSELQKSLRRVEPARKSSRTRRVVPQLESDLEPPLLSTYKIGGRDKDRDRQVSEAESGYRTDTSSTYSQVQDKVSEIQLKIKRLKARATSGDDMTLTLVRDLQGQLKQFERQLAEKETELRKRHRHKGDNSDSKERSEGRRSRSRSRSREHPIMNIDTLPRHAVDRLASMTSPKVRPGNLTPERSSPTKDLILTETARTPQGSESQRSEGQRLEGQRTDPDVVRMSKKELLHEMRKEKKHHHRQIRQLQTELERIRHTDPISNLELNQKDITYDKYDLIGEGMFSKVFKGQYQGAEVAVKCLKAPLQTQDRNYFAAEVSLMRELRHPRVVLLVGVCTSSKHPMMVLEYMSQGSLLKHLYDPDRDSLDHALYYQIARDIAAGMNYLHSHRPEVLHLDLKSNNVLLCQSFRAKIADFGFSKLRHEAGQRTGKKDKQFPSSLPWMAPELLDKGEVTHKADVYSFGMILWEMLTRQSPYQDCGVFQILELVRKKKRPEVPLTTPEGLHHLIQACWDTNTAKRPQFKDVIPKLETLAFPPAWRDLFKKAGVPDAALQNLESTRKIISIVSSTLGGSDKTMVNSFMIPHHQSKDSVRNQSARSRESTLSSSRLNSSRKGDNDGSNWEADTVSTLSGRLSSDESQCTVKQVKKTRDDDIDDESSGSDDVSYSSDESLRNETEKKERTKIDVFIPNLELQLQSARDEFKAQREKIDRISDWVSISIDGETLRTEDGFSQRGQEVPSGLNLNLTGRSSNCGTPTHRTMSDISDITETFDATARSKVLSKQTKTKDISLYSDDHWMRESLDNRRPPSPAKRSLSRTWSDMSESSVSEVVSTPQRSTADDAPVETGASSAVALCGESSESLPRGRSRTLSNVVSTLQRSTADDAPVETGASSAVVLCGESSKSLPRGRSRTLSNVDSSKDSFFGIPIHRQAAPAAVMTDESIAKLKGGDSQKTRNENITNNSNGRLSQAQERTSMGSAFTDVDIERSKSFEESSVSASRVEKESMDCETPVSQKKSINAARSSSFMDELKAEISAVSEAFTKAREREGDSARGSVTSSIATGRKSESLDKIQTQTNSMNDELDTPVVSFAAESSQQTGKTSTLEKHCKESPSKAPDTFMNNYLNNSVNLTPNETLSSRSERGQSIRRKAERESGGVVTKSLDSFSKPQISAKPGNLSNSFKAFPEELSEARKKILTKSVQDDRVKSTNATTVSSVDSSKELHTQRKDTVRQDKRSSVDVATSKDGKRSEVIADIGRDSINKSTHIADMKKEKEQVRVKLNPKEVDAKRLSLSGSVKLKPVNAAQKPAITPRKSKPMSESRDSLVLSSSVTLSQDRDVNKSTKSSNSIDMEKKENDNVRVKLTKDSNFHQDRQDIKVMGKVINDPESPMDVHKDLRKEGKEKAKSNKIKIRLGRDPLDRMPVKQVEQQDSAMTSLRDSLEPNVDIKKKTSPAKAKKDLNVKSKSSTGVPTKSTIKVKVRKDPMAPRPAQVPCSPVPPAPPPPPPSFSMDNFGRSKSVQEHSNRMSMADEIRLRVSNRQSISEGCRLDNKGNLMRPAGRHGARSGVRPGATIMEGNAGAENGAGIGMLVPQQSDGLPSFMVASMELQGQKENLRSISKPHPDQVDELGQVSQEQLSSIADILKKAVMGRRLAMREGGESVSQSLESTATGWSIDTGI